MQTELKGMAINKIQCLLEAVCLPLGTGQVALRTETVGTCARVCLFKSRANTPTETETQGFYCLGFLLPRG